ncbi:MAG: hypothetical protein KDN22_16600 [Verrucomicrobiae bacterium]|nr:hypothetical protein [Verrucomicrobiae bacterium]
MMNHTLPFHIAILAAGLLLLQSSSFAHLVWLEPTTDGGLIIRFGEYGEEPETSPGHLDSLGQPVAWAISSEGSHESLATKCVSDGYSVTGTSENNPAQAQTAFPVMGATDEKPGRRPIFYARWCVHSPEEGRSIKPAADLDIVPTGKPGEFQVCFRGNAVPSITVEAHYPLGNSETFTTDDTGKVTVPLDNPGLYLLSCRHHREATSGYASGVKYDTLSHNATVAWQVAQPTP